MAEKCPYPFFLKEKIMKTINVAEIYKFFMTCFKNGIILGNVKKILIHHVFVGEGNKATRKQVAKFNRLQLATFLANIPLKFGEERFYDLLFVLFNNMLPFSVKHKKINNIKFVVSLLYYKPAIQREKKSSILADGTIEANDGYWVGDEFMIDDDVIIRQQQSESDFATPYKVPNIQPFAEKKHSDFSRKPRAKKRARITFDNSTSDNENMDFGVSAEDCENAGGSVQTVNGEKRCYKNGKYLSDIDIT